MKVYLAGPMSGIRAFNIPAFDAAAKWLRDDGFEVVSPAEVDGETTRAVLLQSKRGVHADLPPSDGGWSAYLERDRGILINGNFDAIVTLEGWQKSPGANREVGICEGLGIKQLEFAELCGLAYPEDYIDSIVEPKSMWHAPVPQAVLDNPGFTGPELGEVHVSHNAGPICACLACEDEVNPPSPGDNGKTAVFELYEDNPERQRAVTGAVKDNASKSRVDLIPTKPLMAVGRVLGFGARKYKPNNWRLGLGWSDTLASSLRHIFAFADGEDIDPESGECHIDNAITQLMFLSEYHATQTGIDDRWSSMHEDQRDAAKA